MHDDFTIFAGRANVALATSVAVEMGARLGACSVEHFPDGELSVRLDEPVRGRRVFIIQPTSPPVNDHLIELLAFADACRRASAAHITAVVPYFGYSRADKRHRRREPITASMVADLAQAVGVNHVVTIDLHAPQIEGFFHIPVDSLTAAPVMAEALRPGLPAETVVVSPDAGRVRMATEYAQLLGAPVAVLHKERASGAETRVTRLVGDVRDRPCLIIDDMISTGGTIVESIDALLDAGARPEITIAATHGLLLHGAREKLARPEAREILVTDTVAPPAHDWPRLRVVSIAPLIASALRRFLPAFSD
ncbi:MAG TPA: ribose-phosphate pyrophosphokinase [Blastocatellia bacterium]|jgi:ribose-phosphate pyrophosphokinase|nr:ribose-phosphate pyrophosphokinase [Blastocatellia bacterium]